MIPARDVPGEDPGAGQADGTAAQEGNSVPLMAWLRTGAGDDAQAGTGGEDAEAGAAEKVPAGTGEAGAGLDGAAAGTGPLADPSRARIINAAEGHPAGDQWSEILTMFVDDPRGSVLEAAALVDEAIEAFLARVREQQEALASSWQARNTGTEELRVALQGYRKFWANLSELRQPV